MAKPRAGISIHHGYSIAFKLKGNCFFLYGFEKGDKSNITENEGSAFKVIAKSLMQKSDTELTKYVKDKLLFEVSYEPDN